MIKIQAVRGMNDLLPQDSYLWQYLEKQLCNIVNSYGYQEIRFPLVEKTTLFKRSIGDVTDIVEKEMYTFEDRNGELLSLRPEGTAGCVRACLEHGLLHNQQQRLWYLGPMFRHERPQKGRYRQFYQFGIEAFGFEGVDIEFELLLLTARIWERLGLSEKIKLELNTIGTLEERRIYRDALVNYLNDYKDDLDNDSVRRLATNPLRVLDSKIESTKAIVASAPKLYDFLGDSSKQRFTELCSLLEAYEIPYTVNQSLVRGLDYYSHMVFEWVTDELGAQGTICAGGRYDGLVEQLGGRQSPAVGFAMGLERLVLLLSLNQPPVKRPVDVYFIAANETAQTKAFQLADKLRQNDSNLIVITGCGLGSFKSQFKKADKVGARFAIVIGEDEIKNKEVTIKFLQSTEPQQTIAESELIEFIITR